MFKAVALYYAAHPQIGHFNLELLELKCCSVRTMQQVLKGLNEITQKQIFYFFKEIEAWGKIILSKAANF